MELIGHLVRDRVVEDGEKILQLLRLVPQLPLLLKNRGDQSLDEESLPLTLLGGDHVKYRL